MFGIAASMALVLLALPLGALLGLDRVPASSPLVAAQLLVPVAAVGVSSRR